MKRTFTILTLLTLLYSCGEVELSTTELKQKFGAFSIDSLKTLPIDYSASPVSRTIQHNLNEYSFLKSVKSSRLAFQSNGKFMIGSIVQPTSEGNYPCIIINHDINDTNSTIDITSTVNMLAPLAAKGYVVIAYNQSGIGGSEGDFNIDKHTSDLENLLKYVKKLEYVDEEKIGLLGINSGAYVNYASLINSKENIKAAVNVTGLLSPSSDINAISDFYHQHLSDNTSDIGIAKTIFNNTPILNLSNSNVDEYNLSTRSISKNNKENQTSVLQERYVIQNANILNNKQLEILDFIDYWFVSTLTSQPKIAQQ